ncbi:MAG TPA: hypothetical protein VIU82_25120 [Bosea sp. (in: a-proteobacteria)]
MHRLYMRALQMCEERGIDPQAIVEIPTEAPVNAKIGGLRELDAMLLEAMKEPFGPGEFESMMEQMAGKHGPRQ